MKYIVQNARAEAFFSVIFLLLLVHSGHAEVITSEKTYVLKGKAFDGEIALTARETFGGAITSMTFRGKEYINAADKGRELQSASTFDGLGECYNPTEAGGAYDRDRPSSSKMLDASVIGKVMETKTDMAFWRLPGERHPKGRCGRRTDVTTAQNKSILSGHILNKRVELGCCGLDNAIQYEVAFTIPESRKEGRFEAISLHTPPDFNVVYQLSPDSGEKERISASAMRVGNPIIFATSDGEHAIALFCRGINTAEGATYGYRLWPATSVARCVYVERNVKPGDYKYSGVLFVGRLDEVMSSLKKITMDNKGGGK